MAPKHVVATRMNDIRTHGRIEFVTKTCENFSLTFLGSGQLAESSSFRWRKALLNEMRECLLRVHVCYPNIIQIVTQALCNWCMELWPCDPTLATALLLQRSRHKPYFQSLGRLPLHHLLLQRLQ